MLARVRTCTQTHQTPLHAGKLLNSLFPGTYFWLKDPTGTGFMLVTQSFYEVLMRRVWRFFPNVNNAQPDTVSTFTVPFLDRHQTVMQMAPPGHTEYWCCCVGFFAVVLYSLPMCFRVLSFTRLLQKLPGRGTKRRTSCRPTFGMN